MTHNMLPYGFSDAVLFIILFYHWLIVTVAILAMPTCTGAGRGDWWQSFRRDKSLSSRNFLEEHIVSDRRQGVFLICIEQCHHCPTAICFHNILTLL